MCLTVFMLLFFISFGYTQFPTLFENDICKNDNGEQGICQRIDSCTTIRAALRAGKRPKICSFVSGENKPIICCTPEEQGTNIETLGTSIISSQTPPTVTSQAVQIARRKCAEYGKEVIIEVDAPELPGAAQIKEKVNLCARVAEPMVLGGEKAEPKEYPHMVLIGYRQSPEWLCGGSLISERYILSAAHCTRHPRKGNAIWAKLGELDTSSDFEDAQPEIFRIIERINHPDYNQVTLYNDISLFKLENDVTFNPYIRPICLSTQDNVPQIKTIATGWGHTSWGGAASAPLMKVELNLVDTEPCNNKYRSTIQSGRQIPQGILGESMVCAGDELGKDTCQGDSGGPLQIPLKEPYCMYDLIGVTSFGRACGQGFPGVYTKVSNYIPWIVENVWPNEK